MDKNDNKFGDWGLGIGDWAQSPIPNPQSPILNFIVLFMFVMKRESILYLISNNNNLLLIIYSY